MMRANPTSPYLQRPLRTLEQAKADIAAEHAKASFATWRRRKAKQNLKEQDQ